MTNSGFRRTEPTIVAPTSDEVRKATVAASVGNFVEWFDFGVYGFLAPVIASQFFPTGDSVSALLGTFAIFGIAFLIRPIGGLVFGQFGDRVGRRVVLSAVVILMSLGTFAIGVLPVYATIGVAAPLLLVLARMVQGFSAGGEAGGAITYVAEYAPDKKRGLFGSWIFFTQGLGGIFAAVLVTLLTGAVGADEMAAWGWRIPFLVALPLGLIGLYLRVAVKETPRFRTVDDADKLQRQPLRDVLRHHRAALLKSMGLIVTSTAATYIVSTFMPAYLREAVGLTSTEALRASIAGLAGFLILCPFLGALSDRIGRKPVIMMTPIAAITLAIPAFLLLSSGSATSALFGGILLGTIVAPFGGAGSAALAELFPTSVRYSGLSIGGAIAISIIGGFIPFLLTWLVAATGALLAPALVLVALGCLSLWAALTLRETAGTALED